MNPLLKKLEHLKSLTAFLMVADCLNTITNIFISTFLVAYFFKIVGQDIFSISSYFIIFYIITLILAILTGSFIKGGKRLLLYRIGIILNFIALALIMILKENIIHYLPLSAILTGSALALKAFTWNLMVSENIPRTKMISFRGFLNTIKGYEKFSALICFSFLIAFIGTLLFVLMPDKGTFIFYNFCCASAVKIFDLTAEVNMFNTANIQAIRSRFKTEYFAAREVFLNIGRITSFSILLLLSVFFGFDGLKYFILLLLCFWFLMGYNAFFLNRKLLKEDW